MKYSTLVQTAPYLTKVKKEKSTGRSFNEINKVAEEERHEKLNFKQYLRSVKENLVDDDYADLQVISINAFSVDSRCANVKFSPLVSAKFCAEEWDIVSSLRRDEMQVIMDESEVEWEITRSITDQLVFECRNLDIAAKHDFNKVMNKIGDL